MFRLLLSRRHVWVGVFCFPLLVSAATLRVPEDFDRIQRALFAAAPGDTIVISAGTYRENFSIDNAITLRGAGIGRTVIVAPNRQKPIVKVAHGGAVTLSDLTLSHADAVPESQDPDTAGYAIELNMAPVVLRNIRIEKTPATYVLSSSANLLTVENLTISAENPFVCISLSWTLEGTRFDSVVLPEQTWGSAITVDNGAAVFRGVNVGSKQEVPISVSGPLSNVKFPELPPEIRAKIEWSNASSDGPVTDQIGEYEKETLNEQVANRASLDEYRLEQRDKEDARRRHVRTFQDSLRKSSSADAAIAALGELLPKIYQAFIGENGYSDDRVDAVLGDELRAIHDRFGPAALTRALQLPYYDKNHIGFYRDTHLAFDLRESLSDFEASQWVTTNIPDLPTVLASWKAAPTSSAASARDAFIAMLETLSTKITSGAPEKSKNALRTLALAELTAYSTRHGAAAMDELLRSLARKPTALLTLAQTRAALSPEQKIQLVQHWKTH